MTVEGRLYEVNKPSFVDDWCMPHILEFMEENRVLYRATPLDEPGAYCGLDFEVIRGGQVRLGACYPPGGVTFFHVVQNKGSFALRRRHAR